MLFRYQERMHLSWREAAQTPWNEVERAFYIWSLDRRRDNLEVKRQEQNNRRQQ